MFTIHVNELLSGDGELQSIQNYIQEERARIQCEYEGETREYLLNQLAYNVGHMVLGINYEELTVKALNHLFEPFGTTFEEVKQEIRNDLA